MGTFTLFVHLNLKSISPARIAGLDLPVPIRPGYRYMNVSCHNLSAQTYSYICVCNFIQQDQCINWHLSWGRAREAASSQANQLLLSCQYYFCLNNSVSSPLLLSLLWFPTFVLRTIIRRTYREDRYCHAWHQADPLAWSVGLKLSMISPHLLLSSLETFTPISLTACSFMHPSNFFLLVLATLSPLLVLPHSHLLFFWFNQNYSFNSQLGVSYAHESSLRPSPSSPSTTATVWSGHPRWLLSWSLFISCSSSACFTYTLLTWLAFPPPCPHPS